MSFELVFAAIGAIGAIGTCVGGVVAFRQAMRKPQDRPTEKGLRWCILLALNKRKEEPPDLEQLLDYTIREYGEAYARYDLRARRNRGENDNLKKSLNLLVEGMEQREWLKSRVGPEGKSLVMLTSTGKDLIQKTFNQPPNTRDDFLERWVHESSDDPHQHDTTAAQGRNKTTGSARRSPTTSRPSESRGTVARASNTGSPQRKAWKRKVWMDKAEGFAMSATAPETQKQRRRVANRWVEYADENGHHPGHRNQELEARLFEEADLTQRTIDTYRGILNGWFKEFGVEEG